MHFYLNIYSSRQRQADGTISQTGLTCSFLVKAFRSARASQKRKKNLLELSAFSSVRLGRPYPYLQLAGATSSGGGPWKFRWQQEHEAHRCQC